MNEFFIEQIKIKFTFRNLNLTNQNEKVQVFFFVDFGKILNIDFLLYIFEFPLSSMVEKISQR